MPFATFPTSSRRCITPPVAARGARHVEMSEWSAPFSSPPWRLQRSRLVRRLRRWRSPLVDRVRENGTTLVKTFTVQPASRFTIGVTGDASGQVPELTDESFATVITSTEPVIVERSLYTSGNGLLWTAGTSSTGTRLEP